MQIDPRFHDAFVTSKLQALRREAEMDHLTREERHDQPGMIERMLQRAPKRLSLPTRQAVSHPRRSGYIFG